MTVARLLLVIHRENHGWKGYFDQLSCLLLILYLLSGLHELRNQVLLRNLLEMLFVNRCEKLSFGALGQMLQNVHGC